MADRRLSLLWAAPSRALKYLPATAFCVDFVVVTTAGSIAVMGRQTLGIFDPAGDVSNALGLSGPPIILGWLLAIGLSGGYRSDVFGAGTDEYKQVIRASLIAAGLVGIACFLLKYPLSRGFFMLAFAIGVPTLLAGRFALRRAVYSARRHGALLQHVVIAGSLPHIDEIAGVLRRETWLGYQVVGALTPAQDLGEETLSGIPVLGNSEDATRVMTETGADVIFFAGGALSSANDLRRIVWELEAHPVQVVVAPSVTDISSERIKVRPVGGLPLMHIEKPTAIDAARWGKRLFDIAGSLALIVAFSPLLLLAAIQIKRHDGGRVMFRQLRTGIDGREFDCLKFRTMVPDAEKLLAALHIQERHAEGLFKMKDDPRVTKPGSWLRRFSLDELPQLINVLRGDMSLVGPRPPLPHEVAAYEIDTVRRLRVRPGMTGLWQVSGRSDLPWAEAIRLDLYYVDNWSMVQDLTILLRTLGAVFATRGAY